MKAAEQLEYYGGFGVAPIEPIILEFTLYSTKAITHI